MKAKVQFSAIFASLIILFSGKTEIFNQYKTLNNELNNFHSNLLTLADAEKILGEKAHITDSTHKFEKGVLRYELVFTADSIDEKSGKLGAVYFLLQEFPDIASAKKEYSSIRYSNQDHEGFELLKNIGDEAYYHSDKENFHFIIVRKDSKMLSMKVNKITSKTSLDEFNLAAENIAVKM